MGSNQQSPSLRADTTRPMNRPAASNPTERSHVSQTGPATGWNESTNPSACHCKVMVRLLENAQNRRRKLHVDVLPYVKTAEPLPGVSTNRPDRFCRSYGVCRTHRVKAIRHAGKSCKRFVAPRRLLGLLRFPITCSPLSTTVWCLLRTDTVHYCKHMPRRGGNVCAHICWKDVGCQTLQGLFFVSVYLPATYSLYWKSLGGIFGFLRFTKSCVVGASKKQSLIEVTDTRQQLGFHLGFAWVVVLDWAKHYEMTGEN